MSLNVTRSQLMDEPWVGISVTRLHVVNELETKGRVLSVNQDGDQVVIKKE